MLQMKLLMHEMMLPRMQTAKCKNKSLGVKKVDEMLTTYINRENIYNAYWSSAGNDFFSYFLTS